EAAYNASAEKSREFEAKLTTILQHSPLMMGSAELDGDVILHLYDNSATERFFGEIPAANETEAATASAARSAAIRNWLARYQESYWTDAPVRFEYKHATLERVRLLAVTVTCTGQGNSGQLCFCYTAEDITDKKKAEESLLHLQQRLIGVIDSTSDCVFVVDADWRLTYLNHNARERFGYGNEMLSHAFWEVYPELIEGALWQNYSKAMAQRVSVEFDMFHEPPGVRYQIRAFPAQDGLVIFFRDVTSEWSAIEDLRNSEGESRRELVELESLYRSAPMCLALFDTNLRFVRINQTLAQLNGVPVEATLGRMLQDIVPSAYNLLAPMLHEVIETGQPVQAQLENPRARNGDAWQHNLANSYPLKDERGNVIGVNVVLLDTTAERQAERAVRQSEERFRQLAEAIPEIVWTADAAGDVDFRNAQWYAYTKRPQNEPASDWSKVIHPADLARCREAWSRSVATGEDFEVEFKLLRYDGVYRWFLCRARPMWNSDGEITKWFGTCTDIDQRKQMEQVLRRSNDDLKQFAAVATRDLQEPLRVLTSFSQMLSRQYRGQLAAEADNYLETIEDAAIRMNGRMQELLAYSPSEPEQQLSVGPIDLTAISAGEEALAAYGDSDRHNLN
ncbi:MAG: PAS domain-containing protein, partial [Bryobacteraceae bacterium]